MIRQTKQRQAILEVVENCHDHPTAAQVFERVRQVLPGIGYATVYRNLGALVEAGSIQEIRVGDVAQYDRRTERHDHAVCSQCGKVVDVELPLSPDTVQEAEARSGFRMTGYHIELYGLCADCH